MARREVEYTDEFGAWWQGLSEAEQVSVDASGGPTVFCMRSIRGGARSCWSAATRRGTTGGTRPTCRAPTGSTTSTWQH